MSSEMNSKTSTSLSDAIYSFLENHPRTNATYLKESKIIDAVADYFARHNKNKLGKFEIEMGVTLMMSKLSPELNLPHHVVTIIKQDLTSALSDCASKNIFQLGKQLRSKL